MIGIEMDISRFMQVYANLPPRLREQIIVVIDDIPMSWNAVYLELRNGTELGARIYNKLKDMEVI